MKLIKLRFVAEKDGISKLIQYFEGGSDFCHCGFYFDADEQAELGFDGPYAESHDTHGVGIYKDSFYVGGNTVTRQRIYGLEVQDDQYDTIVAGIKARLGAPYDFEDIAGRLFHKDWHNEKGFDCSAFLIAMLWLGGVKLLNIDPIFQYKTTPEMAHLSNLLIGNLLPHYSIG
jgi:hypothetical protein